MQDAKLTTTKVRQDPLREPLQPKLWSVYAEGYGVARLRRDAAAGLTVAIVALPLSMAIAIAAGLPPERGLFTAIVGGFFISALGGSRFQIGGPAGAFIVLVAAVLQRHGYDGLLLATAMAGVMMAGLGFLRLGTVIGIVPFPVTVGFTAGIAVVILASQLKDLLGLTLALEPAAFVPKLAALWSTLGTANPQAVALSAASIAAMLALRRWKPHWPGLLIAIAGASVLTSLLALDVATIGSRFGAVPRMLPAPSLPDVTLAKMWAVLPDAMAIALLGAIESLLSAVVADGMTGRRHRSNIELVAQGAANVAASVFSGMPATGTIARTATNIRAGATSPVAGMLHAVYLLLFMLLAAPLAAYIPLAALGAMLAIVAWTMAEPHDVMRLVRASRADALVVLSTFILTVFVDLTAGIAIGIGLGVLLFLARMTAALGVVSDVVDDVPVYRISGAVFFGSAGNLGPALQRHDAKSNAVVLDLAAVTLIDSSGAKAVERYSEQQHRDGVTVYLAAASDGARAALTAVQQGPPMIQHTASVREAVDLARQLR